MGKKKSKKSAGAVPRTGAAEEELEYMEGKDVDAILSEMGLSVEMLSDLTSQVVKQHEETFKTRAKAFAKAMTGAEDSEDEEWDDDDNDTPQMRRQMPMKRIFLTNPPKDHRGQPVPNFQPLCDDFAIGFDGSALRALYQRDGGKDFRRMVNIVLEAFERFSTTAGISERTFTQEYWTKRLWDDLKAHGADYELFLEPVQNYVWTERCSGILGTLATIYRQRGAYQECRQLMEGWYVRMLHKYKAHVEAREFVNGVRNLDYVAELTCLKGLFYKYHRIRINLAVAMLQPPMQVGDSMRVAIQEEIDQGLHLDPHGDTDEFFGWMLPTFCRRPFSQAGLNAATDAELNAANGSIGRMNANEQKPGPGPKCSNRYNDAADLKQCAQCGKGEAFVGTLLMCSVCKSRFYCDKACQKAHWKSHKTQCKQLQEAKENPKDELMRAFLKAERKQEEVCETVRGMGVPIPAASFVFSSSPQGKP